MSEKRRNYFGLAHVDANKDSLNSILAQNEKLYFCGIEFSQFLDPNIEFFPRFQDWLNYSLCYECSVLSMIALKGIPSAKIVQGIITDRRIMERHAWVEFTFGNIEYVADLAWAVPFIMEKNDYRNLLCRIDPKWICTYNDFWDLPLSKSIYECMQTRKNSEGVFEALSEYGKTLKIGSSDYGFMSGVRMPIANPDFFCPQIVNGKPISSGIISEFVTERGRRHPKKETEDMAFALAEIMNSILM